jgi:hypothetical protein
MSGYGPAADESGNIYVTTGNSDPKGPYTVDPKLNLQESVVKLKSDLSISDYFTPAELQFLERHDLDFSAGSAMVIPGDQPGAVPHLAIAAGKYGKMYLLNRDNLGQFAASGAPDKVLDTVLIYDPHSDVNPNIGACWCGQSYFVGADGVGRIVSSGGYNLMAWKIQTAGSARLIKDWDGQEVLTNKVFQKGFFTFISSDGQGADTAVVWAVQRPAPSTPTALTLWAFDAKNGTKLASLPAGAWPKLGGAANTVPVVSNGQVYVASYMELKIFGLNAPAAKIAKTVSAAEVAAASVSTAAPSAGVLTPGSTTILYGAPKDPVGDTGSLITFTACTGGEIKDVQVDVAKARQTGQTPVLVPGRSLVVYGSVGQDRIVAADRIDYGGEMPGHGPGCPSP